LSACVGIRRLLQRTLLCLLCPAAFFDVLFLVLDVVFVCVSSRHMRRTILLLQYGLYSLPTSLQTLALIVSDAAFSYNAKRRNWRRTKLNL
jgi:hypothetical protein